MVSFCPLLSLLLCLYARAEMNSSLNQPPITALIANASQSSLNSSSTGDSDFSYTEFSYIIPYDKPQDCNIYGPICQTGSITIDVNLTTAITSTVLPCASYLSAQSSYVTDLGRIGCFRQSYAGDDGDPLISWQKKFGESQECRSYAQAMKKGQYTISDCGSNTTVIQVDLLGGFDSPSPIPPGVSQELCEDHNFTCCGNCSLDIPEVRLFYFPDKNHVDCQNSQTSNLTSITSAPIQKRVHSLVADGSTAVVSGHTFTSPSLYLELLGTASVVDECTTLGPKLINPIITLSPGALSTWQPPHKTDFYSVYSYFNIGGVWVDPGYYSYLFGIEEEEGISPLNIKDLACPTWGLGKSLAAGTTVLTIGPPWLPLIIPPIEMFSLDPTWASSCTGMFTGAAGITTFELFDPPIALTPAALLVAPTPAPVDTPANPTTMSEQTTPSVEAAKPVSPPNFAAPASRTRDPERDQTPSPAVASAATVESIAPYGTSTAYPAKEGDPSADPPTDPKVPEIVGDPPAGDPNEPSPKSPDPQPGGLQTSQPNPNAPAAPVPQQGGKTQTQAQGLGEIIYNAFGKSGPDNSPTNDDNNAVISSPVTQDTLTIAGQRLVPNPSGMVIGGSSLLLDGSAVTVSNTRISLGSSGVLLVGSSTISLPTQPDPPSTPFAAKALTVAGQTFTPNPSAFPIAGTSLSAGGPAVTVSGTVVSLGPSGVLVIGSSTINVLPTYTTAGQTFTLLSSAVAVAGETISAGGPAVTVDGTIISVRPSGTLIVGSSTIPLLIPQSTFSSDVNIDGFDVEVKPTFAVVDGVTVSPGAAGMTISGEVVSLEAGGETLDVGTGRFALPSMRTEDANGSINVQAFTGGQNRRLPLSLSLLCGFCGTLVLLL